MKTKARSQGWRTGAQVDERTGRWISERADDERWEGRTGDKTGGRGRQGAWDRLRSLLLGTSQQVRPPLGFWELLNHPDGATVLGLQPCC